MNKEQYLICGNCETNRKITDGMVEKCPNCKDDEFEMRWEDAETASKILSALASQSEEGMMLMDEEISQEQIDKFESVVESHHNSHFTCPRWKVDRAEKEFINYIAKAQLAKATPLIEARARKEIAKEIIDYLNKFPQCPSYKFQVLDYLESRYLKQEGKLNERN